MRFGKTKKSMIDQIRLFMKTTRRVKSQDLFFCATNWADNESIAFQILLHSFAERHFMPRSVAEQHIH